MNILLEILGIVGLIMIVLEAALDFILAKKMADHLEIFFRCLTIFSFFQLCMCLYHQFFIIPDFFALHSFMLSRFQL